METIVVSINGWIKKMCCIYVHTHHGILLSHKKNKTLPFAGTWMDLEGNMLSEISQTGKDNYYMISLLCGI